MALTIPVSCPGLQLRYHAGRQRSVNEDWIDWRCRPGEVLACVLCDGLGGFRHGAEAARVAAAAFLDEVLPLDGDRQVDATLRPGRIGLELRRSVARLQQERGDRQIATTLTAVILGKDLSWLFHIGDSRAYLLRSSELKALTADHNVAGESRHVLKRALGHPEREELDVHQISVMAGDRLLLCSDGLIQAGVDDEVLTRLCRASTSDTELADKILEHALSGPAPDNISLVLLDVEAWQ